MIIKTLKTFINDLNNPSIHHSTINDCYESLESMQFFLALITANHAELESLHEVCKKTLYQLSETRFPTNDNAAYLDPNGIEFAFKDNFAIQRLLNEIDQLTPTDPDFLFFMKLRLVLDVGNTVYALLGSRPPVQVEDYEHACKADADSDGFVLEESMKLFLLALYDQKQTLAIEMLKECLTPLLDLDDDDERYKQMPLRGVFRLLDEANDVLDILKVELQDVDVDCTVLDKQKAQIGMMKFMAEETLRAFHLSANLTRDEVEAAIKGAERRKQGERASHRTSPIKTGYVSGGAGTHLESNHPTAVQANMTPSQSSSGLLKEFESLCRQCAISVADLKQPSFDLAGFIEQLNVAIPFDARYRKLLQLTETILATHPEGLQQFLVGETAQVATRFVSDLGSSRNSTESVAAPSPASSNASSSSSSSTSHWRSELTFSWRSLHYKGKEPDLSESPSPRFHV